jgi:hypothetical protein
MGQFELKGIWLIVCAIIAVVILFKVAKKAIKLVAILAIVAMFVGGSNIIDLNTLAPEIQAKVDAVVDTIGESAIRTDGNSVLIKVGDSWYDVSKIAVIGDLATESVVLKYDGQEIYVGETGLMNVLRVLESIGLIHSE